MKADLSVNNAQDQLEIKMIENPVKKVAMAVIVAMRAVTKGRADKTTAQI